MDGAIIKDIGSYKQKLISTFLNCEEICELILDNTKYCSNEVEDLVYSRIFPYLYVDEVQTEVRTYICVEVNIPRVPTNTVKDMQLIIWVYCHKDCMKYTKKGYLGTRVDILSDMIERQLRNTYNYGIGKLKLKSVNHFFPNNKYYGRQIIYDMPDFKVSK